ncbi:MAG: hypothetical protein V1845_03740 [bacterium]
MRLNFKNIKDSPLNLMRRVGYSFVGKDDMTGEEGYQRRLSSGDYPKFHVFIKKDGDFVFVNLHLDQKKASYGGQTAHSGEYEDIGLVEKEAEIIRGVFEA